MEYRAFAIFSQMFVLKNIQKKFIERGQILDMFRTFTVLIGF